MSPRFRRLSKVVIVAAGSALLLAIVFVLPPAMAAANEHSTGVATSTAPVALTALAALHTLAAPAAPAPPAPPEPPDPPAPRVYHVHHDHDDDGEEVERAWLGITLSEIDEEGARVEDVSDDSPAADAGLEEGDRIISIGGKKVISSRDVVRAVRAAAPGDKITIRILRDGNEKTLTATLAGRKMHDRHVFTWVSPPSDEDIDIEVPETPRHHMGYMSMPSRTWLGVDIHPMSPELRQALKAPSDRGLLVNRV